MTIRRAPDGRPISFNDLPEEAFPVTIRALLDSPDGELLWERIAEPYVMIDIPAATEETAGRIWVEMLFADGRHIIQEPLSRAKAEAYIESATEE